MTITWLDMGPSAPRSLSEIDAELKALGAEIAGLLREVPE